MHADVLHVLLIRSHVVFSGKSGQPVPENKDAQRVHSGHQHVDAQIELQPINQVRTTQVTLDHAVLGRVDVLQPTSQKDSFSLGQALRLNDVGASLPLGLGVIVSLELAIIGREGPGEGKESILFRTFFTQAHEVLGHQVLSREGIHPWEMVNFLMVFHFHEHFWGDCPVGPPKIPLCVILIVFDFPA